MSLLNINLLSIYYVPGPVLSDIHEFSHFVLKAYEIESIIVPLQIQKLRYRCVSNLLKDIELVSGRAKMLTWLP